MSTRKHILQTLLLALTICAAATAALSHPGNALHHLYEQRSPSCGTIADVFCNGADLPAFPSNFCCASGSSCWPLAANTTVLCCPPSSDCSLISPITCDLSQQNATAYPDAEIKTLVLDLQLPACGVNCCPWGFSCGADGNCEMDEDQSQPPQGDPILSSTTTLDARTTATTIKWSRSATKMSTIASTAPPTTSATSTRGQASTDTSSSADSSAWIGPASTAGGANESDTGDPDLSLDSGSDSSGMSTGDKIGVSIGAGVGAIVVLLAGYIAYNQQQISKRRKATGAASELQQEPKAAEAPNVTQLQEQEHRDVSSHPELPASEIFELHA